MILAASPAENTAVSGIAFPGNQCLKSQIDVDTDVDGIDALMRAGTVGTLAVNGDFKSIHRIHHGTACIVHISACRTVTGGDMKGKGGVWFGIL